MVTAAFQIVWAPGFFWFKTEYAAPVTPWQSAKSKKLVSPAFADVFKERRFYDYTCMLLNSIHMDAEDISILN